MKTLGVGRGADNGAFFGFLSHNSEDKPAVGALKQALEGQSLLAQGIKGVGSVAVCVGADGLGPWEDEEQQAALQLALRDGRPVIPVRLPGRRRRRTCRCF